MRTVAISRYFSGRVWNRSLRRNAVKLKLGPSFDDPQADVSIKKNFSGKNLIIRYSEQSLVEPIKAYEHIVGYEIAGRELGKNLDWYNIQCNMGILKGLGGGNATLVPYDSEKFSKGLLEGKILIGVGVHGDVKRGLDGLQGQFSEIRNSVSSLDNPNLRYKGEAVLVDPLQYLIGYIDKIDEGIVRGKMESAKKWLRPYWKFEEFTNGFKREDDNIIIGPHSGLVKRNPQDIERVFLQFHIGDSSGKPIIADFNLSK